MQKEAIEAIISEASVCRLGLIDGDVPYIVPLNFGYRDNTLFFHTSPKSRKLDLIRKNPRVGFEMDILEDFLPAAKPCDWSVRYQSVIGFGKASIVEEPEAKRAALTAIMDQYTQGPYEFPEKILTITAVIRVDIESMTGKRHKYPQK